MDAATKIKVMGLNTFLVAIYDPDIRIGGLLQKIGYDTRQIQSLCANRLEKLVDGCILLLNQRIVAYSGGERLYKVVSRRYGLDGEPPQTLQDIGADLEVSHQRAYQLEQRVLRRFRGKSNKKLIEAGLKVLADNLLEKVPKGPFEMCPDDELLEATLKLPETVLGAEQLTFAPDMTKPEMEADVAKRKKKKWYVVWQGRNPGVYETWDECNEQVYRFRDAQYKSYTSKLQAENAFRNANYAVWRGRKPGVYRGWEECQKQVENFPDAAYRSFPSWEAAQKAFESWDEETEEFERLASSEEQHIRAILNEPFPAAQQEPLIATYPILESLSVDAACSGSPGLVEYRGVMTDTGEQLFRQGPFPDGTNNVGEFLALVHALAYLKKQGAVTPIYSDSKIAINWVKAGKCKTKLERTDNNSKLFDLIERAESWLVQNEFENKIYKWDTAMWGGDTG